MERMIRIENSGRVYVYLSRRNDKGLRTEVIAIAKREWPYLPSGCSLFYIDDNRFPGTGK